MARANKNKEERKVFECNEDMSLIFEEPIKRGANTPDEDNNYVNDILIIANLDDVADITRILLYSGYHVKIENRPDGYGILYKKSEEPQLCHYRGRIR